MFEIFPDLPRPPRPAPRNAAQRRVKGRTVLIILGLLSALGAHSYAHHSFVADYLEDQTVSIEGDLTEFDYRAPHAWVHVTTRDEEGRREMFSAEWANPNRLGRDGVTKESLRPGDHVIITGSPSRKAGERKLHLKQIERPSDGWRWVGRGRR
jgi:hypothetical protein